MKVSAIVCTLQVHDFDTSISFFEKLGFNLEWKWPDPTPIHASISSSGLSFMLEKIDAQAKPEKGDLYFRIDGVEQLHKTFTEKNLKVSGLQKTDYGMLDFSIKSPSGHHLTFGQSSGEFEE